MTTSWDWIREGLEVGLIYGGRSVGRGVIVSNDPKRICHLVELGENRVHLNILDVFDENLMLGDGERLIDMVGSYLSWEKRDIERYIDTSIDIEVDTTHPDTSREDILNVSGSNDQSRDVSSFTPRSGWMGMMVKVVDKDGINFAVATIHITNEYLKVCDTLLGKTHVGISVDEFNGCASPEHRKLKDRVVPWPMDRLIASDGVLLHIHSQKDQEGCSKDLSSQKRKYLHVTRMKKEQAVGLTKRQESLSLQDVLLISTKTCCGNQCCQHFDRDLALLIRKKYWEKTFEMRKEYEMTAIRNALQLEGARNIVVVEGTTICLEEWRILHSRGKSQFSKLKKMVKGGLTDPAHGNKGKRRMSERVSQAFASMKEFIDQADDHHPSKLRTTSDKSMKVLRELPTDCSWRSVGGNINETNRRVGCGPVSQSTVSLLKNRHFKEVVIHKKGNNFSKCTTCSELQQRKANLTGNKKEAAHLKADQEYHLDEHTQGRILYHTWRTQSDTRPKEYLCIIHDKMDHCKTAIPRLSFCPKSLDGALQFPIILTGILTHGHGPRAIAQYNVPLWPSDANTMVGSLDSILRILENPEPMIKTLFEGPDSTNLFHKLLFGSEAVLEDQVQKSFEDDLSLLSSQAASASSSTTVVHKPLPRILKIQLDNCAGDNKNRYVMAYLSLLVAREVFEEIQMGFLMVGHTHEDVDAMFGNFSHSLARKPAFSLPNLMGLLMKSRKPHPVLHFIQEVPNFKKYLEPFMLTGANALVGHLKPRLFRFYVRHDKMPCLQYKLKATDEVWQPEEGIEMWSWADEGHPKLPVGLPKRLPMTEIKMLDEVTDGIEKYIGFFEYVHGRMADASKPSYEKLIGYWKDVLHTLKNETIQYRAEAGEELVQGFWPVSKWRDHVPAQYQNVACELDSPIDYVGPRRNRPREAFNPRVGIAKGHIILQRPDTIDAETYPIFLGYVVSEVEEGEVNAENRLEHVCGVKWYRPYMKKKRGQILDCTESIRWADCWTKKWERDPRYPDTEKISVNSVLWSYRPRKTAQTGYITIPESHAIKAKDNLARCLMVEEIE